jgi:hypothetical protein
LRPCAKSGLVVNFMHLTPHLLVTLFRIRVTFLITLFRRKMSSRRRPGKVQCVLPAPIGVCAN